MKFAYKTPTPFFEIILTDCNKWADMRREFQAIQSLVSKIKALFDLHGLIRIYVVDELEPFVTTHMTTIENEIRYFLGGTALQYYYNLF